MLKQARNVQGAGLGLFQVRAIIEKLGDMVGLRSIHGQGSVFSIRLPTGN